MPQLPQFTLTGDTYSSGNQLKFILEFANPDDSDTFDAYEWYFDNMLIPNSTLIKTDLPCYD